MKKYIMPNMRVAELEVQGMLAGSQDGGVTTASSVGNEYSSTDESYSRDNQTLWDQEW